MAAGSPSLRPGADSIGKVPPERDKIPTECQQELQLGIQVFETIFEASMMGRRGLRPNPDLMLIC